MMASALLVHASRSNNSKSEQLFQISMALPIEQRRRAIFSPEEDFHFNEWAWDAKHQLLVVSSSKALLLFSHIVRNPLKYC